MTSQTMLWRQMSVMVETCEMTSKLRHNERGSAIFDSIGFVLAKRCAMILFVMIWQWVILPSWYSTLLNYIVHIHISFTNKRRADINNNLLA